MTRDIVSACIQLIPGYLNIAGDTKLIRMNAGSSNGSNFHYNSILGHNVECLAMAFVVTCPLQECKAAQKDASHSAVVTLAFMYMI